MTARKHSESTRPPQVPRTTAGIIIAVLCFAVVFPVAAHLAGVNAATVSAILAAVPGILMAALGRGCDSGQER